MEADGAKFIDIGGESTRPNSITVSESEELSRVIPVIEKLKPLLRSDTVISIDTTKASVAREALHAGAHLVNDISGGQQDSDMFGVVSRMNGEEFLLFDEVP